MDALATAFRSVLGGRPPPASKDFWISDSMATVCYDCDTPFTLILRRHHCRLCGRVFCGRCTAHSLPRNSGGEPVRVCNFCFQRAGTAGQSDEQDASDSPSGDYPGPATSAPSAATYATPEDAGPAAQLLRRGTLTASAALAAFVEPLWASGSTARVAAGQAQPQAPEVPRLTGSQQGPVRALGLRTRPVAGSDSDGDSDSEGLPTQPTAAVTHRAALASLLLDDEDDSPGGDSGGASSTSGAVAVPSRSMAGVVSSQAQDADLLLAGSSVSTNVGDAHPLSARGCDDTDGGDLDAGADSAASAVADASFSSWVADLLARDAAGDENEHPPPADALPSGWCGDSLFSAPGLDDGRPGGSAFVWAPPPRAPSAETEAASSACRSALHEAGTLHLRRVVAQALAASGVPHAGEWTPVLCELAAAAAASIQPSSAGGAAYSMDPRDYVCVKRIAGGNKSDSRLVRGVACRRSVAHKRMPTQVEAPRLLLLGGALQYQRVEGRLSSLDTLLEQERAHLRVACARVIALKPNVVLVERSCARYAQELLHAAGLALVLNVKPAVLRRLAAATGAQVAPGCDTLKDSLALGTCGAFRCEPLREEHGPPREQARTLMVFDGCPRALCATVLLCGATPEELARVKALAPWAVCVAHHLRLEAAFLGDTLAGAGVSAQAAADVVARAVDRARSQGMVPPAMCMTVSPHVRLSSDLRPPSGSSAVAATAWAAAIVRADERLMVTLCCRCTGRQLLCEPHNARVIHHYGGSDVPLGHFLAAALPGPGRRCSCGDGPEAHVRSYSAGYARLTLRVRTALASPSLTPPEGEIWHWSVCAACSASHTPFQPPAVVRLSHTAAHVSLGRFLELSLAAPELCAPCGHSVHVHGVRLFALAEGTVAIALAPQTRLVTQLPRRTLFRAGACIAAASAWLATELDELSAVVRSVVSDIRQQLHSSWAEHSASCVPSLPSITSPREPPVLLSALEAVLEEEMHSMQAKLRDAALACSSQPDAFAVNRLKRLVASTRRKWTAALTELHNSAWRSSFPVDARRGWAPDDGLAALSPPVASSVPKAGMASLGNSSTEVTPGRALLPLGIGGAVVVIYDDEPTSVIAFALASQRFATLVNSAAQTAASAQPVAPVPGDARAIAALSSAGVAWSVVASPDPAHVRLQFEERLSAVSSDAANSGAARFSVTAYFAPQFQALRALWGVTLPQLLRSLCRCARWDSSGGKSGAFFAKTRDDALVIKALSRPELAGVLDFAPAYAAYVAAAAATDTCCLLVKLVGVFTVHVTVPGKRDTKWDVVVMDNLFAGGGYAPVYDLKGATGKQRAAPEDSAVLLDENLAERAAQDAPLRVSPDSAVALTSAVWRDTAFLARLGVMDYSMLVGLHSGTLAVGIVDYLRQYTWDKQLETYVKTGSAVLSGQQAQQPTVISPKEYARRFRKSMRSCFVVQPGIGGHLGAVGGDEDDKAEQAGT